MTEPDDIARQYAIVRMSVVERLIAAAMEELARSLVECGTVGECRALVEKEARRWRELSRRR